MRASLLRRLAALLLLLAACSGGPSPSNPYDPEADPAKQAPASLSGTVFQPGTDDGHGPLLAGALVRLSGSTPVSPVTTAADGTFAFSGLAPGHWALEVLHPQFTTLQRSYTLAAGEAVQGQFVLTSLSENSPFVGHLTGTVLKSGEQGLPAAEQDHSGIIVEVEDAGVRTVTNRAGRFDVYLNFGTYNLVFSSSNYNVARQDGIVLTAGQTTELPEPVVLDPNPGTVSGKVVLEGAAADGQGDVVVALLGTSKTTVSAPDGSFRLTDVPAGTYLLTASKERFDTQTAGGVVVSGGRDTQVPNLTLSLSRGEIAGSARLNGLTDHAGSVVSLGGTSFSATTAADGSFLLSGVPVGSYELQVRHPAFVTGVVGSVNVASRARTTVADVTLLPRRGDFTIDGGAAFASDPLVSLGLSAQGVAQMRISEDPQFTDASWTTYTTPAPFTLSPEDGTKTVYAQYRDADGIESIVFSASIVLDRTAPLPGTLTIDSGSGWSRAATGLVTLGFSASDATSGVTEVELSNDSVMDEPWETYVATKAWTLASPTSDGVKTVYARFRDAAGNVSPTVSAQVTLDRIAPQLSTNGFTVDCGNGTTGTCALPLVVVKLAASGAAFMALSNEAGFPVESYQPFSAASNWFLSPGDGSKTVYLRLKDLAGNVSSDFEASVKVDGTAPTISSFSASGPVADGATSSVLTSSPSITLALAASDALSSAARLQVAVDEMGTATTSSWTPYTTSRPFSLSYADGTKTLVVRVKDEAGNIASANATITLDTTPPLAPSLSLPSSVTSSTSIVATLGASGATQVCLWGDIAGGSSDACVANGWESLTATKALTLTSGSGTKTVNARFRDAAGNVATAAAASVVLDSVSPSATSAKVTITGTDRAGPSTSTTSLLGVTVALSGFTDALTGVKEMMVSENAAFAGASWQTFASSIPWTLSALDGTKTIYAKVRDGALNESAAVSGSITLDRVAPDAGVVLINGGAAYASKSAVSLAFYVQGSAVDYSFNGSTWIACPGGCDASAPGDTASYDFGTARGAQTLKMFFRDAAGNVSQAVQSSIFLDDTAPGATSILSVFARTTTVELSLQAATDPMTPVGSASAPGSGIGSYEIQIADPDGKSTPTTTTFSGTTGTITGLPSLQSYQFTARAVDLAGNAGPWSAPATAVTGLGSSLTEGAVVGLVGDRVFNYRGILLWPRIAPGRTQYELVTCDTRRERCRDAGLKTTRIAAAGTLTDVAIAATGRTLVLAGMRSGTVDLLTLNGSLDAIADPASWSTTATIPVGTAQAGSLVMAANGRGMALAWSDFSQNRPVIVTCDGDIGSCARNASLWGASVVLGDATTDLTSFGPYGLSLDAGANRLWVSWPAKNSGSTGVCTSPGMCGYAVASCTQTNNCALSASWGVTRFSHKLASGSADGARPHATRILEVGNAAYVLGEQFVYTPAQQDSSTPLAPAGTPTGPVLFKCTLPANAAADACRNATDWSSGAVLRTYGGFEPLTSGRAALESWNGSLHMASVDPASGTVYYGRCKEAAADCAQNAAWDVAKVLLAPNPGAQPDLAVLQGNPVISWARDAYRTIVVEPPTPAPLGRAIVPDYATGGVKATWVARDADAVEGYRVDYNTSGPANPFDQQVVTGDPAADELTISTSPGGTFSGVVASFNGDDLGLAEPRFKASGARSYTSGTDISSAASTGLTLPRYGGNGSCQVVAYASSQSKIRFEACPRTSDCTLASNWKSAEWDTGVAVGSFEMDVNTSRIWLAMVRSPDPMPGVVASVPLGLGCQPTTTGMTNLVVFPSTITTFGSSGTRWGGMSIVATDAVIAVAALDQQGTLMAPSSYGITAAACSTSSGCDTTAKWYSSQPSRIFGTIPVSPMPYSFTTPVIGTDGTNLYLATPIQYLNGPRAVDVWACAISANCSIAGSWVNRHNVFANIGSTATVLLRGQGTSMNLTAGDAFATCTGSCLFPRAWSRSNFAPDPLGDTPGRWGIFATSGGDQVWTGGALGQLQIGRCRQRCWLPDSWLGGFTMRDASIVDTPAGIGLATVPGELNASGELSLLFAQKTGSGNSTRARLLQKVGFDFSLP